MAWDGISKLIMTTKLTAICLLLAFCMLVLSAASFAQFAEPLQPTNDLSQTEQVAPGTQPATQQPPPIGSGTTPQPVTRGDTSSIIPPPTGLADITGGTNFPNLAPNNRPVIHVFRQTVDKLSGVSRGYRETMTIRPDQLSQQASSQISSILGQPLANGQSNVNVYATDSQIAQINQALEPYPQTTTEANGHNQITSDTPATGYPREQSAYQSKVTLPTVRKFARILIILGVVSSTVFMAMAAAGIVFGTPYAGARVLGALGGLALLLMSFTIWKVVQMNTYNSDPYIVSNQSRPATAPTAISNISNSLPILPTSPLQGTSTNRSGVPLQPYSVTGH